MNSQYVIPPPDIPEFLYKVNLSAWQQLINWAKREHIARLKYCADKGYHRQFKWFLENSSPIKILAEMPKYRKLCALVTSTVWDRFTARERNFVRKSYELRDFLRR